MVVRPMFCFAGAMLVFVWILPSRAQPASQEFAAEQLAALSNQQLRAVLAKATDRLSADLDRLKGGAPWKTYFQVSELKKAMSEDGRSESRPSDPAAADRPASRGEPDRTGRRSMLSEIADRFDKIAGDQQYRRISACSGFQTLQVGLREYTLPPQKRQQHVVAANLRDLVHSLDQFSKGASWKQFLELDQLERLATSDARLEPTDFARMAQILSRFEAARQDADFRVIAERPGFDATYAALADLFQLWE
jgi:hypothetical protein